jgi:hypothetical protein
MEIRMELHDRANRISSKEDLADFVGALRVDLATNPGNWENPNLDRFLSAMEDWIRAMNNYYVNAKQSPVDQPTWKTFADILMAAKMYE